MKLQYYTSTNSDDKVKQLINIARLYIEKDNDSADKYFFVAKSQLEQEPDIYWEASYYNAIGDYYNKTYRNKEAVSVLKKCYSLFSSIDSTYDMAIVNTLLGTTYTNLMKYDSSLYYLNLSNRNIDSTTHTSLLAANLNNMANAYESLGRKEIAMNYYLRALTIFNLLGQKNNESISLRNIGLINMDLQIYDQAIAYLEKAENIDIELDNKLQLCSTYNSMGIAYREITDFDTALIITQNALDIAESLNNDYMIAQSNHNMGVICNRLKLFEDAIRYFSKSLEITEKYDIVTGSIYNMISIGKVYTELGDYYKADGYLFDALRLCENNNFNDINDELYQAISVNYQRWGKYNSALQFYQLFEHLKDSINNLEKLRELQNIQIKYETDQKEIENQQLKVQNKLQEYVIFKQRIFVVAFVLLSIIAILVIVMLITVRSKRKKRYLILRAKNRKINEQSEELTTSNQTKDKLFSIIAHDLRSPFGSLMGFSSLLQEEAESGNFENILYYSQQLNSTTKSTFELLDNLLNWSRSQQEKLKSVIVTIDLNSTIDEIIRTIQDKADEKQIIILNLIVENTEVKTDKNMLMVIVRNLVSNAIKFTPKGGEIKIISRIENDWNILSIQDNGVGMEKSVLDTVLSGSPGYTTKGTEMEQGSGLGLMLVKDFVERLGGMVWVESTLNEGSVFSFKIPKNS